MHIMRATALTIAIAFVQPLYAQGCSGGMDGGMDATGNQCSAGSGTAIRAEETATTAEAMLQRGLAEYERGHYAAAARHLRDSAGRGDTRAAAILALMYRYGERLYGSQIRADAAESARWSAVAVKGRATTITQATAPAR